tara:strand:- start:145871 stop:146158 length:288 start_codon:yes stop_codon:yes gene_type:complete
MKNIIIASIASVVFALSAVSAQADQDYGNRCNAPMAEWQPRENLQQKLEAEGWQVKRIKTDDGCYEVYAIDKDGNRIEAYFDPKSLKMLRKKSDD